MLNPRCAFMAAIMVGRAIRESPGPSNGRIFLSNGDPGGAYVQRFTLTPVGQDGKGSPEK